MTGPLVEVRDVSHDFGAARVLSGVSLDIPAASYTVLLGPSGSGKTTLLSILGGFLAPREGRVLIGGRDCTDVPPARRPTTTVFQDYALFPHMSVGGNVGFGLRMRGDPRAQRTAAARQALDLVGLSEAFDRRPHELSGGQRQRVALARALVVEPAVLLLDEPLGALDLKLRRQMQDELKAIQKRVSAAFVHVTHDQEEAMALADMLVVMNHGRIVDEGPPEQVYSRPRTRFSATFMGESSVVDGRVVRHEGAMLDIDTIVGRFSVPGAATTGRDVAIAIRPETLRLGEPRTGDVSFGHGVVHEIVFQGSFRRVIIASETDPAIMFTARVPLDQSLAAGERVHLSCPPDDIIVLEE
ncbi:MAG TPA: ABC transporter ATP-binding protein [Aestuariivirgaceae bacterium]|nr:ABC transporter ATP-binding protein [Aestuariivirgaceae bacterium]